MSIDDKRRLASIAFLPLLALSGFWPSPLVSINRLCCNAPLSVDELSFLGRESASWDVAFWCLVGLLTIMMIDFHADYGETWRVVRTLRLRPRPADALALLAAAALVALVWLLADAP